MSGGGNADRKWGVRKMEGEDSVKTVDCLRGRLLAERVASRNAKEEAEQLGNKLMELENLLKQEAKSRNKAEKKLKSLMKKLASMNISYVSDESEYSGLVDKSEISSISSTTSSSIKEQQEEEEDNENQQARVSKVFETQESKGIAVSQKEENSLQNDSRNCLFSLSDVSSAAEGSLISAFEAYLAELQGQECEVGRNEYPWSPTASEIFGQNFAQNAMVGDSLSSASGEHSEKSSSEMDQQSYTCYHSIRSSADEGLDEEHDQDADNQTDNSMALVLVDAPQENHTIDPEVVDATVKEVLDALRHAREQLQSSMERRRTNMIRVG